MAKVISLFEVKAQSKKQLVLEAKLEEVNNKLKMVELSRKALLSQRTMLEERLYTPRERAEINLKRKAEKVKW